MTNKSDSIVDCCSCCCCCYCICTFYRQIPFLSYSFRFRFNSIKVQQFLRYEVYRYFFCQPVFIRAGCSLYHHSKISSDVSFQILFCCFSFSDFFFVSDSSGYQTMWEISMSSLPSNILRRLQFFGAESSPPRTFIYRKPSSANKMNEKVKLHFILGRIPNATMLLSKYRFHVKSSESSCERLLNVCHDNDTNVSWVWLISGTHVSSTLPGLYYNWNYFLLELNDFCISESQLWKLRTFIRMELFKEIFCKFIDHNER